MIRLPRNRIPDTGLLIIFTQKVSVCLARLLCDSNFKYMRTQRTDYHSGCSFRVNRIRTIGAGDIIDFFALAVTQSQMPRSRIGFELEVAQIRHDNGIDQNRFVFGAQNKLKSTRRCTGGRVEAMSLQK